MLKARDEAAEFVFTASRASTLGCYFVYFRLLGAWIPVHKEPSRTSAVSTAEPWRRRYTLLRTACFWNSRVRSYLGSISHRWDRRRRWCARERSSTVSQSQNPKHSCVQGRGGKTKHGFICRLRLLCSCWRLRIKCFPLRPVDGVEVGTVPASFVFSVMRTGHFHSPHF